MTVMNFGADVSRLLDIVAHALYSNRDVFLRELISNASDACDKLRYAQIAGPALKNAEGAGGNTGGNLRIEIAVDAPARLLTVRDNGIGMNREELAENLGTIAKSGTAKLMESVNAAGNETDRLNLIGQFGVGFYASFMVAGRVEVVSRKAGEDAAWHWESDGKTGFSLREAGTREAGRLNGKSGTAILLHINDDASEYLVAEKIKTIVKSYSDHIDFPIFLTGGGETADAPVNAASALWMRPKHDVAPEQYTEFYHHISHGFDEPLLTCHWRAEGTIEYSALLFVPTLRPWDLYDPTRKNALRLYVRRVFITDDCEGLVYPWLRFLRGVVDSQDLPLNISREMLQHNPVLAKIRNGIAKKVLSDLNALAGRDDVSYAAFWGQFGAVLKEGLYDAPEHRDALLKASRFFSTNAPDVLTSLEDYVSRMKENQNEIYYLSGENIETLRNSPQLEGFRDRGLEVLFFTDTIDDFWLQSVHDYDGRTFKSVTKGHIDLSRFDTKDGVDTAGNGETAPAPAADAGGGAHSELLAALSRALADNVSAVRASTRLTGSPVCLVAAENEIDLRMERVLRVHQKYEPQAKRVLEINPKHKLILGLSGWIANAPAADIEDAAHLLYDQALIIQGEPVPDPGRFSRTMARFMESALAAGPGGGDTAGKA